MGLFSKKESQPVWKADDDMRGRAKTGEELQTPTYARAMKDEIARKQKESVALSKEEQSALAKDPAISSETPAPASVVEAGGDRDIPTYIREMLIRDMSVGDAASLIDFIGNNKERYAMVPTPIVTSLVRVLENKGQLSDEERSAILSFLSS